MPWFSNAPQSRYRSVTLEWCPVTWPTQWEIRCRMISSSECMTWNTSMKARPSNVGFIDRQIMARNRALCVRYMP